MMASGKSTVSNVLKEKLPRTAIIGMDSVKHYLTDLERGKRDNLIGRKVVIEMAKKFLEVDISVIIEQPISKEEVEIYEKISKDFSATYHKFQLFTSPEIAFDRAIKRQVGRKDPHSEERIKRNIGLFRNRADEGFETIDSTEKSPEEIAGEILTALKSNS